MTAKKEKKRNCYFLYAYIDTDAEDTFLSVIITGKFNIQH